MYLISTHSDGHDFIFCSDCEGLRCLECGYEHGEKGVTSIVWVILSVPQMSGEHAASEWPPSVPAD